LGNLPIEEQQKFEEHKEQLIKEAQAKFLANFKVDRNNKVVLQWATDLASLQPATTTPKVRETNEIQSLRAYIDGQREQMQQIIGGMQNDKRLVHAFDKSIVANFLSHKVESGEKHVFIDCRLAWPITTPLRDADGHIPRTTTTSYANRGKSTDLRTNRPLAH
jgi:hypothetical protein